MVTFAVRRVFKSDAAARTEAMKLLLREACVLMGAGIAACGAAEGPVAATPIEGQR